MSNRKRRIASLKGALTNKINHCDLDNIQIRCRKPDKIKKAKEKADKNIWINFVREVQNEYDVDYGEALRMASPIYWESKMKERKRERKESKSKSGLEELEELVESLKMII